MLEKQSLVMAEVFGVVCMNPDLLWEIPASENRAVRSRTEAKSLQGGGMPSCGVCVDHYRVVRTECSSGGVALKEGPTWQAKRLQ